MALVPPQLPTLSQGTRAHRRGTDILVAPTAEVLRHMLMPENEYLKTPMPAQPMDRSTASPTVATYMDQQYVKGGNSIAQPVWSSTPTPAVLPRTSAAFVARSYPYSGSNTHHVPTPEPPQASGSSYGHTRNQYFDFNTAYYPVPPPIAACDPSLLPIPNEHRTSSADRNTLNDAWRRVGGLYHHSQNEKYGYVCDYCVKLHKRPQDLKRHLAHIHGQEVISCMHPGCEEVFPKARRDYMLRHFEADHGVQTE
ncbi:hypothetical protein DE146DRAFT_634248 [Phaeosphaeria sp. MPI-PUGE-AT-0046c]|nr:hypothetical protein DE146DRAFT_634248 [Phaeosphaeria sp. MPI-PUGE-AT-0046c]